MTRLEELRAKLAAGIDWREDARTMRQLLTVAEAADDVSNDGCPCFRCVKIRAALAPLLEEVEK
jgi:hypothetical protein